MQPIIVITLVMLLMSACTNVGESVDAGAMSPVPPPLGGDPNPGQQGNSFSISTDAFYQASLRSASSPGKVISLSLSHKGQAIMNTDYLDKSPVINDIGDWTTLKNGNLLLNMRRPPNNDSIIMEFKPDGDKLVYTGTDYGSAGLTLWAKHLPDGQ